MVDVFDYAYMLLSCSCPLVGYEVLILSVRLDSTILGLTCILQTYTVQHANAVVLLTYVVVKC